MKCHKVFVYEWLAHHRHRRHEANKNKSIQAERLKRRKYENRMENSSWWYAIAWFNRHSFHFFHFLQFIFARRFFHDQAKRGKDTLSERVYFKLAVSFSTDIFSAPFFTSSKKKNNNNNEST